jgi:hypothetical protein
VTSLARAEECSTVVKFSIEPQAAVCSVASSTDHSTAKDFVVELNSQVKHTIDAAPGKHVTVSQCYFEADGADK